MTDAVVLHPASMIPTEAAVVTVMEGAVGAHVGLYYRDAHGEGTRRHLHLAWHLRLEHEQEPPPEAFWVVPRPEEFEMANLAAAAHLIATRQQDGRVPYAFDSADARFERDGTLQLNQSRGLTCATFIILMFEYVGIRLLEKETWEQNRSEERQREDAEAQRLLVEYLRSKRDHRSHGDLVAGEVGSPRIRAEEVAAASGMTGRPISLARAEPEGRRVLALIRGRRAGAA